MPTMATRLVTGAAIGSRPLRPASAPCESSVVPALPLSPPKNGWKGFPTAVAIEVPGDGTLEAGTATRLTPAAGESPKIPESKLRALGPGGGWILRSLPRIESGVDAWSFELCAESDVWGQFVVFACPGGLDASVEPSDRPDVEVGTLADTTVFGQVPELAAAEVGKAALRALPVHRRVRPSRHSRDGGQRNILRGWDLRRLTPGRDDRGARSQERRNMGDSSGAPG
jgi:hypothetical protein